ncbi:type II toxin-antitoxin system HipA family toxin [Microlunatus soli]|uniref:Serine/threonine-protein kinase HipA n=1 Tax=Microlunatus soli TaxID=630515 RepID=A0A1H1Y2V2_9ACTN|nr:HipA domain-containing protein [Microlunatus soli]SDT15732.1 serine/threonine-protein kinase HipA [Microlunatus soli]
MADLLVELYGNPIGALRGTWRTFDFHADRRAVGRYGLDSMILSVAIPLAAVTQRSNRARRQLFFAGLLPEGRMLSGLADEASLPVHDTIGLLRRYGRDVAGALQIWDPDVPGEPKRPAVDALTESGVAELLLDVGNHPLANKPQGGKTSLAGVQDKIVLARTVDGWARVLDGYPSTHILKPQTGDHPTMIYDEEYGSRIARALGLIGYSTTIDSFDDVPALVIERYDRSPDDAGDGRIHQEDFSQALGLSGDQKYQRYGGGASLARVASVLARHAGQDSLRRLLTLTTLSVAIGNLDLHTKNLSLLHSTNQAITLAPAYDVVPQTHLPTDGEMALTVAGKYRHAAITRDDLVQEGTAWGIRGAASIVADTLDRIVDVVGAEAPLPNSYPGLADDIGRFTRNLAAGKPAGG